MARWIRFLITVALGVAGGLYYGWVINPVDYLDMTPDSLRADYQADYVLMVAEAYRLEGDLGTAVHRLAMLGDTPPAESVAEATLYAVQASYGQADLLLIQQLADDLQTWNPDLETFFP